MQPNLEDQAIKAALDGNWQQAIEVNQSILANSPNEIAALNRLAKAFSQVGQTDQAMAIYESVLKLDKFNAIALKKYDQLKQTPFTPPGCIKVINTDFIEEPGKTKTTSLVRLGDNKLLGTLQPGQLVNLVIKTHWIAVTTQDNTYIGALADNISFRLKQFIAGGNQFQAVIRTASIKQVDIFIREIFRAPQFANTPSL